MYTRTEQIGRRCKYCGNKLKMEFLGFSVCYFCDNDICSVKPLTEYSIPSIAMNELREITQDREEL